MGIPQFISSSYRAYSVDFDNDGVRDLSGSVADAIGSVGAYLSRHGWRRDNRSCNHHERVGEGHRQEGLCRTKLSQLQSQGVRGQMVSCRCESFASCFRWARWQRVLIALRNFYVITRYNHSPLYAGGYATLARNEAAKQ